MPKANPRPVTPLRYQQRTQLPGSRSAAYGSADGDDAAEDSPSGPYRTLCVRTCDGYYFPISPRASHSRFKRDAKMCNQMCGHDAKLYVMDRDSTDMTQMESVDGEPYSKLPTAFAYRKSLINGCTCKPMPWSEAERSRHAMYAVADAVANTQRENFDQQLAAKKAAVTANTASVIETGSTEQAGLPAHLAPAAVTIATRDGGGETLHLVPGGAATLAASEPLSPDPVQLKRERPRRSGVRSQPKPKRVQTAIAAWGFGGGKYTWPGDGPGRKR